MPSFSSILGARAGDVSRCAAFNFALPFGIPAQHLLPRRRFAAALIALAASSRGLVGSIRVWSFIQSSPVRWGDHLLQFVALHPRSQVRGLPHPLFRRFATRAFNDRDRASLLNPCSFVQDLLRPLGQLHPRLQHLANHLQVYHLTQGFLGAFLLAIGTRLGSFRILLANKPSAFASVLHWARQHPTTCCHRHPPLLVLNFNPLILRTLIPAYMLTVYPKNAFCDDFLTFWCLTLFYLSFVDCWLFSYCDQLAIAPRYNYLRCLLRPLILTLLLRFHPRNFILQSSSKVTGSNRYPIRFPFVEQQQLGQVRFSFQGLPSHPRLLDHYLKWPFHCLFNRIDPHHSNHRPPNRHLNSERCLRFLLQFHLHGLNHLLDRRRLRDGGLN